MRFLKLAAHRFVVGKLCLGDTERCFRVCMFYKAFDCSNRQATKSQGEKAGCPACELLLELCGATWSNKISQVPTGCHRNFLGEFGVQPDSPASVYRYHEHDVGLALQFIAYVLMPDHTQLIVITRRLLENHWQAKSLSARASSKSARHNFQLTLKARRISLEENSSGARRTPG